MSQESVEVVRRAYEVFNRQGAETVSSSGPWSAEIVFDPSPTGIPGLGVYRGYDEVRRFLRRQIETAVVDTLPRLEDGPP